MTVQVEYQIINFPDDLFSQVVFNWYNELYSSLAKTDPEQLDFFESLSDEDVVSLLQPRLMQLSRQELNQLLQLLREVV